RGWDVNATGAAHATIHLLRRPKTGGGSTDLRGDAIDIDLTIEAARGVDVPSRHAQRRTWLWHAGACGEPQTSHPAGRRQSMAQSQQSPHPCSLASDPAHCTLTASDSGR